ncbi:protein kinase [Streptomyces sp. CAU 1734]|uniref:protein kinase n=1 Tax=Streptomyces sp. CAU 1734 TaxID=3140360 RepID=UPI003261A041
MEDYAGRVLADRYRLPLPPSDEYELADTRGFDTYSGQEVLIRQVPLPEVVEAEVVGPEGPAGSAFAPGFTGAPGIPGRTFRGLGDPAVLRAVEAAQAAARIPDHPRLDQVFDVFAEAGSLWIVSERVAARPLAALLAEKPLSPYRAAEVASDVLTALDVLHAHGWTHRNITARTVLVCDDGRVVLTGLASGAAEEALCGYAPVPRELPEGHDGDDHDDHDDDHHASDDDLAYDDVDHDHEDEPEEPDGYGVRSAHDDTGTFGGPGSVQPYPSPPPPAGFPPEPGSGLPDLRAARSGAIAAYRAGARAAARSGEEQRQGGPPVQSGGDRDWWARKPGDPAQGGTPHDDPEDDGDEYDSDGPGYVRLAGSWHDGPLPGQEGPGSLPAGGGQFAGGTPGGLPLPAGFGQATGEPRPLPAGFSQAPGPVRPLPAGFSQAPDEAGELPALGGSQPNPHRDTDPYGVRQSPPAGAGRGGGPAGDPYRDRPVLPAGRSRTGTAPVPMAAAGGWDRGGAGREALRADAQRLPGPAETPADGPAGRWDDGGAGDPPVHRGPATPLAAERARQARIAVVGAVTERWAPEQAGPVHENWQLAAPVGPATDLWALGALLYRSVQGHAPYPEENASELVQLVCSEPPAFAEECGPLRPVVESLLRQDPTERPDVEELRGWLRSLVRSAPEPDAGVEVIALPPGVTEGSRLPVVRRRGELVRRRRRGSAEVVHGRHRHKKPRKERGRPRTLGRTLLLLILLLVVGAIAYAMVFMPKTATGGKTEPQGDTGPRPAASQTPGPERTTTPSPTGGPASERPRTSAPAADAPPAPAGFTIRDDTEGFRVAVEKGWRRSPINDIGQIRYSNGDFTLIVVPGRDTVSANGDDPLVYQRDKERELQPFRDSTWAEATGLRRIEVGRRVMAEGQYTWQDTNGRQVYVRNLALIVDGRYHVVQVIGPDEQRDRVTAAYRAAADSYRTTR